MAGVTLDGKQYWRELNTMPQWAGSCWYYLRFCDAHNDGALIDPQVERYWMGGKLPDGPARPAASISTWAGGARRPTPAIRPFLAQSALRSGCRFHA